jgi:hypothetical protein
MTWAFSDESERAATMLFGVLFVEPGAVADARNKLRGLLLPAQRRVHTAKESPRRRRQLLDVVAALEARGVILELRRDVGLARTSAREQLLSAACRVAIEHGVVWWVLDYQEPAQAHRDRRVIDVEIRRAASDLVHDHRYSYEEPLLWAVDAIVWAAGAGGDWRSRIGDQIEFVRVRP